ncbi:MAG: AMP-binding protein [Anaerolineae bacterium]
MTSPARFPFDQPVVWHPSEATIQRSRLRQFMARHDLPTVQALIERARQDIAWFWEAVLDDLGIEFFEPYTRIVDLSRGPAWPEWCVNGRMNIVHNCLDRWMDTPTQNRVALRWESEEGTTRLLSYRDLLHEVNRVAAGLRARGVGQGDAVGLYMPMTPECAIALLAVARIGAIILPLFSGYGAAAVATRLADAEAKALFVADGQFRRGTLRPMKPVADEALAALPGVHTVVVVPRTGAAVTLQAGRDLWWDDLVAGQPHDLPPEHTRAEAPLMIIYTSGTTGRPKGALHTHCGFPIKSAQDMAHGFDFQPADTMYWMTDIGWMMGPWEIFGVLLLGGSMLLYDGAPDYPDVDRVWALVARHGVTHLGVAPTFIRAIMAHGAAPVTRHDLRTLRILGSTGEAWNPEPWRWFFDVVGGGRLPIINYSGGTEIGGGIVLGNVLTPLKPCAFSGPAPGMDVAVVDDSGQPVQGAVGELVVRQPWIGMTRGFWKDPERYEQTYWRRFPDVWVHGDFAAIDADGLYYILGRSDDTIKTAGKRVGPAEIENSLVAHPDVIEAAAIGVPDPIKGEAIVVFVVLDRAAQPSAALRSALQDWVAQQLGKPLAPKTVHFVEDIPRTRNAKIMRRLIRAAYLGQPLGDMAALVNPEAVEAIRALAV